MLGGLWLGIWLAALGAGGLLSALAQSLRDLSRPTLEDIMAIRNRPGANARLAKILDDQEGHAASVALPRIFCNLIVVVAMTLWLTSMRGRETPDWIEGLIAVVVTGVLVWIFGSVLPAAIAKHAPEVTVYAWSPLIRLAYILTGPLKAVIRFFDEVVRRLAGRPELDEAEAVQEEILSVVEEARQEGQVDESERDMIEAVVSFRNTTVAQIMTPRTEIEAMEAGSDLSAVTAFIRQGGHSRIPVYEDSLDHILGIFYVKDLMKWLAGEASRGGKTFDLRRLLRPAMFVPETKTIRELLSELLSKRVHIAIVADEYGGTAGLVTIEDIVEEVFGDIQDEYEQPGEDIPEVKVDAAARTAEIDARSYVSDVNDALRPLAVEIPESEDYDTVGGFVVVTMGRIPTPGETLRHEDLTVTVLEAEPTRVTRVRLEAPRPAPESVPAQTAEAAKTGK